LLVPLLLFVIGVVSSNLQQLALTVGQGFKQIKAPWVRLSETILNCGK
jgi:hypothetical protein